MNEESQVRGCYNITFYLHQPGNSVGSPLNQMHRQQLELLRTDDLLLQGLGERGRGGRDHFALRPQKRSCLLGTGTEWEEDERVKARPRIPPEKDRRDRGPPPEQWKC